MISFGTKKTIKDNIYLKGIGELMFKMKHGKFLKNVSNVLMVAVKNVQTVNVSFVKMTIF